MSMAPEDPLFAPEPSEGPEGQPLEQQGEGGAAPGEQVFEIGGRQVPISRLQQLMQVDDAIAAGGPEFFQRIADVVTGRARVTYEPDQPPSHLSTQLPGAPLSGVPLGTAQERGGPGAVQEQGVEGGAAPPWEVLANEVMSIRATQAEEAADLVRQDIAARYNLTPEQVADVQDYAVSERIVENRARARGRMVGGRVVVPSPRVVLTEALDMAARLKGYSPAAPGAPTQAQTRRQNRQLVGTSGGQASRQPKAPTTQQEHEDVMTAELYRAFGMPLEGGLS